MIYGKYIYRLIKTDRDFESECVYGDKWIIYKSFDYVVSDAWMILIQKYTYIACQPKIK